MQFITAKGFENQIVDHAFEWSVVAIDHSEPPCLLVIGRDSRHRSWGWTSLPDNWDPMPIYGKLT